MNLTPACRSIAVRTSPTVARSRVSETARRSNALLRTSISTGAAFGDGASRNRGPRVATVTSCCAAAAPRPAPDSPVAAKQQNATLVRNRPVMYRLPIASAELLRVEGVDTPGLRELELERRRDERQDVRGIIVEGRREQTIANHRRGDANVNIVPAADARRRFAERG